MLKKNTIGNPKLDSNKSNSAAESPSASDPATSLPHRGTNEHDGEADKGFITRLISNSKEKRDVIVLGFNFFLLFTMYSTAQNYITSVNDKWGFWSLALLYIVFSIASLLAPAFVKRFPPKPLFVLSSSTYVIFVVSQIWVNVVPLMIASVLIGVGASVLWTGQGTYVSAVTPSKSKLGESNGLFWAIFVSSLVVGNLFAAIFLIVYENYRALFVILAIVGIIACLSFLLLRNPPASPAKPIRFKALTETVKLFSSRPMLLLSPLIVASGVQGAFAWGAFSTRVPSNLLGFCFVTSGACNMIGGLVFGRLSDKFGRQTTLFVAYLSVGALLSAASFATNHRRYLYFIALAFSGFSDAASSVVLGSILPIIKPEKVAPAFGYKTAVSSIASSVLLFVAPLLSFEALQLALWFSYTLGVILVYICDRFVIRINAKAKQTSTTMGIDPKKSEEADVPQMKKINSSTAIASSS